MQERKLCLINQMILKIFSLESELSVKKEELEYLNSWETLIDLDQEK